MSETLAALVAAFNAFAAETAAKEAAVDAILVDLASRLDAIEPSVDAEIDDVKVRLDALEAQVGSPDLPVRMQAAETELARLDARLDAISGAAGD